jgi:hypothetical protein
MIVYDPWYVPNIVIRREFQTPTFKEEIRHNSSQYSVQLSSEPLGATQPQAYQILSVMALFVV